MAYRNGTYVAFHANNTSDPTESDMKYYRLLTAWKIREEGDFEFIDSHAKTEARDWTSKETLRTHMKERLRNSKNMILLLGPTTRFDRDWVPFEIEFAVDECTIPIIAAYPGYLSIPCQPNADMKTLWPSSLRERIVNGTAKVIHVPFKQAPIQDAVGQFSYDKLPNSGESYYGIDSYKKWGLAT
jgi:hypothetical protein